MALDKRYIDRLRIVVRGRNRTPVRVSAKQENACVDMEALEGFDCHLSFRNA